MYQEKYSIFECGFHSFLGQNRSNFYISFFVYGILYLILDLEIVLIYPYAVSSYVNDVYGLIIMLLFTSVVTLGFIFEICKDALVIYHRQNYELSYSYTTPNRENFSLSYVNSRTVSKLNLTFIPPPLLVGGGGASPPPSS